MVWFLLSLLLVGLVAGAVARLLVPGRNRLTIRGTIALGVVGSFLGGFLGYLLFGDSSGAGAFRPSGLVGSIVGATIALAIYRGMRRRRRRFSR